MKTCLLPLLFLFISNLASAQTWENKGPEGGFFKDFVIHPSNTDIVYAGSDDGGGVWKTTDGGETWSLLTGDYPNFTGWHIEMDPNDPETLYFCELYGRYGILKTTDGGASFSHYTDGFIHDRDFQTTQLVVYPGAGDTLFVSTGEGDDHGRVGNGVFASYNSGESWTYRGLQGFSVHCVEVSTTNRLLAGTEEHGLHYSDDVGESWLVHPDIPDTASILQIDIKDGVIVVSAAANGVFASFDNGASFENIGIYGEFNFDLSIVATSPYLEVIATGFFGPNYYTSETMTWTPVGSPLMNDQLVIGVEAEGDLIYAGIFSSTQIIKTTNGGETWSQLDRNPAATEIRAISVDPNSDRVYASLQNSYNLNGDRYNKESLSLSTDGGTTWTPTGPLAHGMDLAMHPAETQTLFLGTFARGLFKTTDGFETWENIRPGNKLILDVEIDPDNPDEILLAELDIPLIAPGVFRSTDGGETWSASGVITATHIRFNTTNDDVYFSTENGIHRSTDNGVTISPTPVYLPGEVVLSMHYEAPFLYAGTEEGKLYKIDADGMVEDISGPWNTVAPTEVRNIHYAGNSLIVGLNGAEQDTLHNLNGGVWQSVNEGASWEEITGDLTNTNIFGNTGIASGNDGQLWLATYGLGVFKSEGLVLALPETIIDTEAIAVFPNPSAGDITVLSPANHKIEAILINTLEGKKLYEKTGISTTQLIVEKEFLDKGVLLMTLQVDGNKVFRKLVIQ